MTSGGKEAKEDEMAGAPEESSSALARVAALRAVGVKLRNEGLYWLVGQEESDSWWLRVKSWWDDVVARLAEVDPAEAELFRVLNYFRAREYRDVANPRPQHLKNLQMLDELLERHEAAVRLQQTLRSAFRREDFQS